MAHTQILYQLVFATKNRLKVLGASNRSELYKYMQAVMDRRKCYCFAIGGVEEHVHLVFTLHPSVALADLVKDLKVSTSLYIKKQNLFPSFTSWAVKYGAFTYDIEAKDNLVRYVLNQVEHHKSTTFEEEYLEFMKEFNVEYDERFVFE